ncbi:hypothetical protein [Paenibacillus sp. B-A-8]|uniref:hypothetical protein n=1 Tax=Paenibacillus sp. B-A-8 TaxID=3400419 RepID=UPI003B02BB31
MKLKGQQVSALLRTFSPSPWRSGDPTQSLKKLRGLDCVVCENSTGKIVGIFRAEDLGLNSEEGMNHNN